MNGSVRRGIRGWVLALLGVCALGASAASLSGQWAAAPAPRGWLGISVDVRTTGDVLGRQSTTVTVTEVAPDSPAAAAGVLAGDELLAINGLPYQEGFRRMMSSLVPGAEVSLVVRRAGARRNVRLVAGARPDGPPAPAVYTLTVRADSMAESMYRAMDSLKIRLVREGPGAVELVRSADGRVSVVRERAVPAVGTAVAPTGSMTMRLPDVASPPGPYRGVEPMAYRLFDVEGTDSLRREMHQLEDRIRVLRTAESERRRVLRAEGANPTAVARDGTLSRIDAQLREVTDRHEELRRASGEAWGSRPRIAWGTAAPQAEAAAEVIRPLAPYVLGQNRAAGAEVVELKPELASYFQVRRGVLVVDVPAGTPAAVAGLEPGDVITALGSTNVSSVGELRLALARTTGDTSVRLVRKGRSLELLLRR